MPKTLQAAAAGYDAAKQYRVTLSERATLSDHHLTLYPGKDYILSGSLAAEIAEKILTAQEV